MTKHGLRLVGLLVVVDAILLVAAYALSQAGGASWFPAIVFVLVAVLATAFIATGLSPGRRTLVALPDLGGLVLTPVEVSYESYLRTHTLPWDQVSAVHKHPTVARLELRADQEPAVSGPRPRAGERPVTPGRAEQLTVPTGLLRMDADRLLRLLDFYRTHPRARHELGDGTAWTRRHEDARR